MGVWKTTGVVKVVNVAFRHSCTGHAQGALSTIFRVSSNGIDFGGRVKIYTGILLEVDASGHRPTFGIGTVTSSQEHGRAQEGTTTAPDELSIGIIKYHQAYKRVFKVLYKIAGDRIRWTDYHRQDRQYREYSEQQFFIHLMYYLLKIFQIRNMV